MRHHDAWLVHSRHRPSMVSVYAAVRFLDTWPHPSCAAAPRSGAVPALGPPSAMQLPLSDASPLPE